MNDIVNPTVSSPASADRVTPALYESDEVFQHFEALYLSLDFRTELADMDIGLFQVGRKKLALRELRALTIALWGIALERSFPQDAETFFLDFRKKAAFLNADTKESNLLQSRVNIYVDMLKPKKDTDFLPVAQYLTEVLAIAAPDMAHIRLKLSLTIRALYNLIFNRLV